MLQVCSHLYSTQDLYSTEIETQEVLLHPSTYHTEHTFQGREAANACGNNQNLTNLGPQIPHCCRNAVAHWFVLE